MKLLNIKMIAVFILSGILVGCGSDDEENLPKVIAGFTQTLDEDTGTITFLNISENATKYEWDFGNGDTSTEINPTKTFETGTFTVKLTASNDAGGSDTFEDVVMILIKGNPVLPMTFDDETIKYEPTNFGGTSFAVVDNPQVAGSNDKESKVGAITNSGAANEGLFFDLSAPIDLIEKKSIKMNFWSDKVLDVLVKLEEGSGANVEASVSHAGTGWEEVTFDFASADKFARITIFVDGPGTTAGTFYMDDVEQAVSDTPPLSCTETKLQLPIDFDCDGTTYDFEVFNGTSYKVVDNPQLSGINAEASKVGEITNSGAAFEGGAFTLATPVDFSTMKAITMKVYSTVALPVLLKFEGAGAPIETPANHGGTGWEQMTFNFTSSDTFNKLVLFVDGPGTTAGTFYIDDIEQTEGSTGGGGCTETNLQLPLDFDCESTDYNFEVFNGASYQVIDNPELSGVNAEASKVGEIVNAGGAFEGGAFTLATPVDFSTDKAITMKVYSTVAIPVLLKFEGAGAPIETPVNHGGTGWEQLTFNFTSSDSFNKLVLFMDGPGTTAGTFYIDDIEQVAAEMPCMETVLQLPIDFDCESTTYDFGVFNGATYQVIDNPELSGVNAVASKVGEIVNAGGAFEGGAFTLGTPVDFSTDKTITMKVYSTVAIPVLLKFEGAGAPIETPVNHGGTGWEQLTFNFTSSDSFDKLVLFMDGPGTTAGTFYIDDIEQISSGSGGGGDGDFITNGDFETGDMTGWLFFDNNGSTAVSSEDNNGGSFSAKIVSGPTNNPGIKQERFGVGTIQPNQELEIKLDSKVVSLVDGAIVNVLAFSESDTNPAVLHNLGSVNTAPGAWNSNTFTFTTAGDVSGGVSILIEVVCGGASTCDGEVFFDNVSLKVK